MAVPQYKNIPSGQKTSISGLPDFLSAVLASYGEGILAYGGVSIQFVPEMVRKLPLVVPE